MSTGAYCQRSVSTAKPEETLRAAAQRMEKEGTGSLVVVEDGKAVGVLTDRDVALDVIADRHDPDERQVRNAIGRPAVTIGVEASLSEATELMHRQRLRRLPVVGAEEQVEGVISADDLVRLLAEELMGLAQVTASQLPVAASGGAEAAGAATAGLEAPPPARTVEHYRREVHCLREDTSARALAVLMKSESIGCVVVTSDGEDATGVVTDRDLVTRVIATGSDPDATPVHTIMGTPPVTAEATQPLEAVVAKMRSHGVRRVPIVSDGKATGIVTYDDLLVTFGRELVQLGEAARAEIRHEQRAAQGEHVRHEVERRLRDLGSEAANLGHEAAEKLRGELDNLRERFRRK